MPNIYAFASDVKAHIDKLEDGIIATKNAEYIFLFAANIEGAHIDKLEDGIIATGDAEYIYKFAKDIKNGKDIDKLEDGIIATGDAEHIYYFAKDIKNGKDIDKLEDGIIESKNAKYIYQFARDVENANIDKLEDAIIATKNAHYIYKFAKDVKEGKNIEKLENAIIKTKGDTIDFLEFAKLPNTNTDKIELYLIPLDKDLKWLGEVIKKSFLNKLYFGEKDDTLKYLIENREIDINEIRLRIYFDYLNNPNSTGMDLEKCNEEYIRYVFMYYGEKNKDEETKENLEKDNEQGKTLVKTKKINR